MTRPEGDLLVAAMTVRQRAHAPYSRFRVGAALLSEEGEVFTGCNVESASYGLSLCAERGAVSAMVAFGHRRWTHIVVLTDNGGTPCGACRQVLAEFAARADAQVWCAMESGVVKRLSIAELLPHRFQLETS